MATLWWFLAMLAFFAIEGATVSLVSLWFAGGAMAAMIATLFSATFPVQFTVFVVVSALCLLTLRPLFRKYIKPTVTATNMNSLVGKVVLVTEIIRNLEGEGAVKVNDVTWTARSTSGATIEPGCTVRVDRVEGSKVYVSPAEAAVGTK